MAVSDEQWLDQLQSPPTHGDPDNVPEAQTPSRPWGLTRYLLTGAAATTAVAVLFGSVFAHHHGSATVKPVAQRINPAPATTSEAARPVELPLAFRSSADCPPGASNDGRGLANLTAPTPWICVYRTAGQTLALTLTGAGGAEHAQVITGFTIVPGVVAAPDAAGKDPWMAHRCVKWIRLQFNDVEHSAPIDLDTGCVRGEASVAVPGVTASRVTMIVREVIRPPAAPTPTPQTGGDVVKDMMFPNRDEVISSQPGADPADGTFAVGGIKIMGHEAVR